MNKKDVQKRVLKDGKPLALSYFTWCEKTGTFSSEILGLVIDFTGIDRCTFKTGWDCTFNTGSGCTFNTRSGCTFNTGSDCTFNTGCEGTFNTGSGCTFKTGWDCTFNTGSGCTFNTGSGCTFKTGWDCTFNTGSGCTFNTGWDCTFNTGSGCTFNTRSGCVIVNRNVFEVIQPEEEQTIQICPYDIPGHLVDGMYNGEPHIIADGILSKIINQKGDVYKLISHGEKETSYLVKSGDVYSHGKTLKEARDSLVYKISDRDTSKYEGMTKDTVFSFAESVAMYRTITGACESGVRYFVENNKDLEKNKYTVGEIIEMTKGQYGNDALASFVEGR